MDDLPELEDARPLPRLVTESFVRAPKADVSSLPVPMTAQTNVLYQTPPSSVTSLQEEMLQAARVASGESFSAPHDTPTVPGGTPSHPSTENRTKPNAGFKKGFLLSSTSSVSSAPKSGGSSTVKRPSAQATSTVTTSSSSPLVLPEVQTAMEAHQSSAERLLADKSAVGSISV
jgi:hypothetical protein